LARIHAQNKKLAKKVSESENLKKNLENLNEMRRENKDLMWSP
jgi:hypothetical protein